MDEYIDRYKRNVKDDKREWSLAKNESLNEWKSEQRANVRQRIKEWM